MATFKARFSATFAHPGGITAGAVSPTGSVFATGGRDGVVRLWDLDTGSILISLTGATQPIEALAFNRDGTLLAAAAAEGVFRVYTLEIDRLIEIGRSKVTRPLSEAECRQYLHPDEC